MESPSKRRQRRSARPRGKTTIQFSDAHRKEIERLSNALGVSVSFVVDALVELGIKAHTAGEPLIGPAELRAAG